MLIKLLLTVFLLMPADLGQKQTPQAVAFYHRVNRFVSVIPFKAPVTERICDYVNSKLPARGWNQCFFNLGTEAKGKDVGFCQSLSRDPIKVGDCVSGLYNGVNLAYLNRELAPPKDDHFSLCRQAQSDDYRLRCHRGLVHSLYRLNDNDPVKGAAGIDLVEPEDLRYETYLTFFSSLIYENYDPQKAAFTCGLFTGEKRLACIQGYATGIVEVAENGEEEKEIVAFCSRSEFSGEEKELCIERGFSDLRMTYEQK